MKRTIDYRNKNDMEAKIRVDEGNALLKQQNVSGAIKKYDQAIDLTPYYAIPHYNKRIALSLQNDNASNNVEPKNISVSHLIKDIDNLNVASTTNTFFVVNSIALVPERSFNSSDEDSSDEEADEEFDSLYEQTSSRNFPFTTKKTTKLTSKVEIFDIKLSNVDRCAESRLVDPFLFKLKENGFEQCKTDQLSIIAVSMGLNRMYSLSTRKNDSLISELHSRIDINEIKYKIFGFYWYCVWYNKYGQEANIEDVRSFYKKLKRRNPNLAKRFLEQEENEGAERRVPYQHIREYAKNHEKTKELIRKFRNDNANANIYLHLVDADVYDFNGIYSAYLRTVNHCYLPPTIMTTGHVYPEETQNKAFHLLSHMERMHRVITTFYIPLGTYYPEPNMCILIPQSTETVEESFIDRRGNGRTLESPILLTNIQSKRQTVYAIFSDDNPILTFVPSRCKVYKQSKKPIEFSNAFNNGPAGPTQSDIGKYDQVSQSQSNTLNWSHSLFINNSIKYDSNYESDGEDIIKNKKGKGVYQQCHKLIANIRKNTDVELSKSKLDRRIGEDNANDVVNAIKAIADYNKVFNETYARTPEEQELIDMMIRDGITVSDLSRESLLMIVSSSIMELITDHTINLRDLINLDEESLEFFYENQEITETDEFANALAGHNINDILKAYREDPMHLELMGSEQPWDVISTNFRDLDYVRFALNHNYIDADYVYDHIDELWDYDREDSCHNQELIGLQCEMEELENEMSDIHF